MSSELKAGLANIKAISYKISSLNATKKTTRGKYPISLGYPTAVRRPVNEILRWMKGVERLLETIIEEAKP